jgi:spore germination protein KB
MQTNSFSSRRWVYLITIYIFGSSAIIGSASKMKQDAWIAILMSLIYIIPLILVCARIMTLYPNKNLYEIVFALFGKVVGSVISVLFIWYCLHLGALVLNNYVTFLFIVQIPDTPQLAIALVMIPAIIYVAKKGLRCL